MDSSQRWVREREQAPRDAEQREHAPEKWEAGVTGESRPPERWSKGIGEGFQVVGQEAAGGPMR